MKRIVSLLLSLVLISSLVSAAEIKYYAYGDSYTACYGSAECYVHNIEPGAISDHNTDGICHTSAWGLRNLGTHYNTSQKYVLIMFGRNDEHNNINPLTTAKNLEKMYRLVESNGSQAVILLRPLTDPSTHQDARKNISIVESYLTFMNVPHIGLYDSIDSIPENGIMDAWVNRGNYQPDGSHQTSAGQVRMGNYLWNHYYSSFPPGAP